MRKCGTWKASATSGSGIAVVNTGHRHPLIVAALKRQLDAFSHTCIMVTPYASAVELAEKLCAVAPIENARAMFLSTGAEAVENAIKIARATTGRPGVIAFSGGFHGRTNLCMGLTGKVVPYKKGFGPFTPGIYHAPFPAGYLGVSADHSLAALQQLFKSDIEPEKVGLEGCLYAKKYQQKMARIMQHPDRFLFLLLFLLFFLPPS